MFHSSKQCSGLIDPGYVLWGRSGVFCAPGRNTAATEHESNYSARLLVGFYLHGSDLPERSRLERKKTVFPSGCEDRLVVAGTGGSSGLRHASAVGIHDTDVIIVVIPFI